MDPTALPALVKANRHRSTEHDLEHVPLPQCLQHDVIATGAGPCALVGLGGAAGVGALVGAIAVGSPFGVAGGVALAIGAVGLVQRVRYNKKRKCMFSESSTSKKVAI